MQKFLVILLSCFSLSLGAKGFENGEWYRTPAKTIHAAKFMGVPVKPPNALGLGAIFGIGTTQLNGDGIASPSNTLAWHIGGSAQYNLGRFLALNSGIILQKKGGKEKGTEVAGVVPRNYPYTQTYSLLDLQIPFHVQAHVPLGNLKLMTFAGPDLNFNLVGLESRKFDDASYNNNNGYSNSGMSNLEVFNLGLTYGVGVSASTLSGDEYFLRICLSNSLNSIGLINTKEAKHNMAQVSLGYIFR